MEEEKKRRGRPEGVNSHSINYKMALDLWEALELVKGQFNRNQYINDALRKQMKKDGYIELKPANAAYPTFKVEAGDNFEVWGVVIHMIRTFEKL